MLHSSCKKPEPCDCDECEFEELIDALLYSGGQSEKKLKEINERKELKEMRISNITGLQSKQLKTQIRRQGGNKEKGLQSFLEKQKLTIKYDENIGENYLVPHSENEQVNINHKMLTRSEIEKLPYEDEARHKPTLEHFHHHQPNIIPQEGDYMVVTLQHFNAIVKAGYKINGSPDSPPHDRMGVMYLGKHGLSQCTWGSPAQTNGRAIYCEWPGHWKLGLTPLDAQREAELNKEDTKKTRNYCQVKD